jgi:hypothetical protein
MEVGQGPIGGCSAIGKRLYGILGVRGIATHINIHESTIKLPFSSLNIRCTAILYVKYEYKTTRLHN